MKNIRIGILLLWPIAAIILTAGLITAFSFHTTQSLSDRWRDSLTSSNVLLLVVDSSRSAQVHLKKQVQEWKDLLLRGNDPQLYEKYFKLFQEEEKLVREDLDIVRNVFSDQKLDISPIDTLLEQHRAIGAKYRHALQSFDPKNSENAFIMDRLVKGIDRDVTKQMDGLVDLTMANAAKIISVSEESNDAAMANEKAVLSSLILLAALLGAATTGISRYLINNKLQRVGSLVRRVARGDVTLRIPLPGKRDTIDQMASDVNALAEMLERSLRAIGLHAETIAAVVTEAIAVKEQMTKDSKGAHSMAEAVVEENARLDEETERLKRTVDSVTGNIDTVSQAADQLSSNINTIAAATEQASQNVNTVASAAEEMTANISQVNQSLNAVNESANTVAAAIEELTASLNEVRTRCVAASSESSLANQKAQGTSAIMDKLAASAAEIGKVVEIINNIAEQTNMLALNAAIESAGAGDAGKGFAVVANEVKELARQTGEATRMISQRIAEIQTNTRTAATANQEIAHGIERINYANQEITQAIAEQHHTVQEIAGSMEGVANAAREVTRNALEMERAAQDVSRSAQETAIGTHEIARSAGNSAQVARQVADATNEARDRAVDMQRSASGIFAASVEVQKTGIRVMDIINYLNGSIHQTGMLTEVISDTSTSLNEAAGAISTGAPPFKVQSIKQAHLAWLSKLEHVIRGRSFMKPEEVATGHDCAFGKWYDSEGTQKFGHMQIFQELGRVHMRVHEIAREVVSLVAAIDPHAAETKMEEFNVVRKQLFVHLDALYQDEEAVRLSQ